MPNSLLPIPLHMCLFHFDRFDLCSILRVPLLDFEHQVNNLYLEKSNYESGTRSDADLIQWNPIGCWVDNQNLKNGMILIFIHFATLNGK